MNLFNSFLKSRDISVGIDTDYGLDDRMIEVRIPEGAGNFLSTTAYRLVLGTDSSFLGGKTAGA
jgi:hypothetical protein